MGLFNRISGLFGNNTSGTSQSPITQMQDAIEVSRVARRSENYRVAWNALSGAIDMASASQDVHSVGILQLYQAELLVEQERYDEADEILTKIEAERVSLTPRAFIAYVSIMRGRVYLGRGNYEQARTVIEQALTIARDLGEPGPEGRALGYLADVYLADNNPSYAIHLLEDGIPKLTQVGDTDSLMYFTGRWGDALVLEGRMAEGRRLLDQALRQAEQVQDQRLIRRWAISLGDTAFQQGKYDEAVMFYQRTLALLDEVVTGESHIRALINLSYAQRMLGQSANSVETAQKAYDMANMTDISSQLEVQVTSALGMALQSNDSNTEAIPYLEQAIEQLSGAETSEAYVGAMRVLAIAYSAVGRTEDALHLYERGLARAEAADDLLAVAEIQRDWGLVYMQQKRYTLAVELWTKALTIFEQQHRYRQVAQLYCDLANVRYLIGLGKRAIRDYESALVALNHVDDMRTRGVVLSNAANAYVNEGDIETTHSFFNESIAIARQIGDHHAESLRLGNYGWFLNAIRRPQQALEKLDAARFLSSEHHMPLAHAIQTDNMGLVYDNMGKYDKALEHHDDALTQLAAIEADTGHWPSVFAANRASTLVSLGRPDEATPAAQDALSQARAMEHVEAVIIALATLSRAQLKAGDATDHPAIEQQLSDAERLATNAGYRHLLLRVKGLQHALAIHQGDTAKSEALQEEADKLADLLGVSQPKQRPNA